MAWSWTPVPRRLLRDHRVLRLDRSDRSVLFSLYLGADEHGRFNADEMSLRVTLGFLDTFQLSETVERLSDLKLVHLYRDDEGTQFGVLDRWCEDLGLDIRKRRPRSTLPNPPADVWEAAKCQGGYRGGEHAPAVVEDDTPAAEPVEEKPVRTASGHGADSDRTASGLEERKGKRGKRGKAPKPSEQTSHDDGSPRRAALLDQMKLIKGGGS